MTHLFHLTLASELTRGTRSGAYVSARYAADGFIHCAGDEATTLQVAASYFAHASEPVVVLKVEVLRLRSPWKLEAPAPLPGGSAHRAPGKLFPHVYGPINLDAVVGKGVLGRDARGALTWPLSFEPL